MMQSLIRPLVILFSSACWPFINCLTHTTTKSTEHLCNLLMCIGALDISACWNSERHLYIWTENLVTKILTIFGNGKLGREAVHYLAFNETAPCARNPLVSKIADQYGCCCWSGVRPTDCCVNRIRCSPATWITQRINVSKAVHPKKYETVLFSKTNWM